MTDAGCRMSDETSEFDIQNSTFFIEKLEDWKITLKTYARDLEFKEQNNEC